MRALLASSDHWSAYRGIFTYCHKSGAITYLTKHAMSINEGGTPINIHLRWARGLGFYLYLFGFRLSWFRTTR